MHQPGRQWLARLMVHASDQIHSRLLYIGANQAMRINTVLFTQYLLIGNSTQFRVESLVNAGKPKDVNGRGQTDHPGE
jgi:hypothetical protein